ncbi:MAG: flagellar hook-basal body protein [Patulibacter sp.]
MERGLSIAASGMVAEMARQDILSADVANATTPGYKADRVSQREFGSLMVTDLATGRQAGSIGAGARIEQQVTNLAPSDLRDTGEPLDLAVLGEGYFAVQTADGVRYTRNGSFQANSNGLLVDQQGNQVLGPRNQPVRVNADGTVDAKAVGCFAVPNAAKVGENYFTGNATGTAAGEVHTGALETSGLDAASSVVQMLASLRAIEAGQKALTTIDESLGKANQVGSLR